MEKGKDNSNPRDERVADILVMLESKGWKHIKEEETRLAEAVLSSNEDNLMANFRKYKVIKDFIARIEDYKNI